MKKTFDSNVFVYSILSKICAERVNEIHSAHSIHVILRSVKEECENKLLDLFKVFITLEREAKGANDLTNLISSRKYELFSEEYPQLFKTLHKAFKSSYFTRTAQKDEFLEFAEEVKIDITKLLKLISDDRIIFPVTQEQYEKMSNEPGFNSLLQKLAFVDNRKDRCHLGLIDQFIKQTKTGIIFITVDANHFTKNKKEIEALIPKLEVNDIKGFDPENFIMR